MIRALARCLLAEKKNDNLKAVQEEMKGLFDGCQFSMFLWHTYGFGAACGPVFTVFSPLILELKSRR
ncbi:hypothetical protein ACFFLM_03245 [Deinococcus oregonensis]|uniref:Uncharacterized protein n=1 Tax=Deinococcus oregonensis TaxID=1805970 RepID=A0ABV6AVF3_9DEIO